MARSNALAPLCLFALLALTLPHVASSAFIRGPKVQPRAKIFSKLSVPQADDLVVATTPLTAPMRWTLCGISASYLAHFASLYTQLPGLYGDTGLQPVTAASPALSYTWLLHLLPSPQLGMETFGGGKS
jgi:hypothetical protein